MVGCRVTGGGRYRGVVAVAPSGCAGRLSTRKDVLDHKWSFVSRSPFASGITLRQDDPLDYKISDLIYLTPDFLVESLDHPFLIRLTMTNSKENGVTPVEVRVVVRYPCRANGNISCQSL